MLNFDAHVLTLEGVCPFGSAWVDTASADNTAHAYAECSNRGACDRKTGECECYDGFTGTACRYSACADDCSGHGTCEYISDLASDVSASAGGKDYLTYGGWDTKKTRGCKCDPGYAGPNCASRMCPKGDDPLTKEVDITQTETTSLQVSEVQTVSITPRSNKYVNGGSFTLTYTDLYNGKTFHCRDRCGWERSCRR